MRDAFMPYAGSLRIAAIVALLLFGVSSASGALLFSLKARNAG
jgi:predicted S18 family serine protease